MLGVWIGAIQNIYPELGRRRGGPFGSAADYAGRRYHALNPETFYWARATFFMLIIKTAEYFCGGLTEAEKRQLFDEHVQWYRMYGMSMRPVPESWEEFCEYWDRKCREELEINQATLDIFSSRIPKPWFVLMPTPDAPWSRHPAFMGPPADRRGLSMHYVPRRNTLLDKAGSLVHTAFSLAGLRPAPGTP